MFTKKKKNLIACLLLCIALTAMTACGSSNNSRKGRTRKAIRPQAVREDRSTDSRGHSRRDQRTGRNPADAFCGSISERHGEAGANFRKALTWIKGRASSAPTINRTSPGSGPTSTSGRKRLRRAASSARRPVCQRRLGQGAACEYGGQVYDQCGKKYAVNTEIVWMPVVYYNKEAFQKAGVELPKTFDDLYTMAPKLKDGKHIPMTQGVTDAGIMLIDGLFLNSFSADVHEVVG